MALATRVVEMLKVPQITWLKASFDKGDNLEEPYTGSSQTWHFMGES